MDPGLYPGDVMVATAESFPTVFFLYAATMAATFAGIYRIGRWAGGDGAGALAVLFAVPVRIGLAGEALYRPAFSHSHVASALAIWAMAWFLEGRRFLPLLVLSLGAYNHLLYSVYVLAPMLLVVLFERRAAGTPRTLRLLAAGVLPLLPLLVWAVAHGTPMTPEWLELLRVRSSHHSFPSAFLSDLPDTAALLALGALFASSLSVERRRLVALFTLAIAVLFVVGTVFTEWLPVKAVLQLQPHRAWRFLLVLLQSVIAAGVVAGYREGGFARPPRRGRAWPPPRSSSSSGAGAGNRRASSSWPTSSRTWWRRWSWARRPWPCWCRWAASWAERRAGCSRPGPLWAPCFG